MLMPKNLLYYGKENPLPARTKLRAGLDVFEEESLPADHPLTQMDNVILSPHGIAWTDDLYHGNGPGACQNILSIFQGQLPQYTVNQAVVERPGFQAKLNALCQRWNEVAA